MEESDFLLLKIDCFYVMIGFSLKRMDENFQ